MCTAGPRPHTEDDVRRLGWAATLPFAITVLLFAACSSPAPSKQTSTQPAPAAPSFVNIVWRVESSNAVGVGQLYVFLSEGTLVIASTSGHPALGSWKQQDRTFTMVEEGIAYPVEILELTETDSESECGILESLSK